MKARTGIALAAMITGVALVPVTATVSDAATTPKLGFATGTLYSAGGKAAGAGQKVQLIAWPANSTLAGLKNGQKVSTVVVSTGTTDRYGHYNLDYRRAASRLAAISTKNTKMVNFSLQSPDNGASTSFTRTASVSASTTTTAAASTTAAATAAAVKVDRVDLHPLAGAKVGHVATGTIRATSGVRPMQDVPTCGWYKVGSAGTHNVDVAQAYTISGAKAAITYTHGSNSKLGVGASVSGAIRTFSASGTNSVESTDTLGFPTISGATNRAWRTTFHYSKYGFICDTDQKYRRYEVRADAFEGDQVAGSLSRPAVNSDNCSKILKNGFYIKDKTTAKSFAYGADLSGTIGIDLSVQTGYSDSTVVRFDFSKTGRLCGLTAKPPSSNQVLIAANS